ncbi:MAG: T9SS type A sorting domain-containing protein [candidate division WOR-3 bacterium]
MIYQIMPKVSYNYISNTANGGSNFTSIGYGIMNSTTTNGGGIITNNVIDITTNTGQLSGIYSTTGGTNPLVHANNSLKLSATGGSGVVYFQYVSGTYPSITITNNVFMTNGITSTGTCYLIYNSTPTQNVLVSNNVTSGIFNRSAASGTFYGYYNYGSPAGGTEYLLNNNFSNINLAGSSAFYGIYSNTATAHNRVASGNIISNIVGGTGTAYCLYFLSTTSNQIYNNTVDSIVTGGTVYGLYFSGTNPTVYNNLICKIRTTGTTIYGIYNAGSGTTHCYNNKVHSLTSMTTSSPIVDGIYVSTGTSNNIYNNFISDLNSPSGSSATAIAGIYIAGGTAVNLYYNSIYINATSTGATFGTMGVYASTTPTVDMRNNVIVNTSTPNGTGLTVAYRRSSTTLTTYASTSNNNCFYAGTPSASRLIFYDGTNADQTLAQYKARVAPRDWYSVTEAVDFVSATDLHINPTTPTRLESGAQPISWITTDIDGQPRVGSTEINTNVMPDIGADEFSGTPIDEFGPVITYTPLPYTSSTGNRTLTATIIDLISGVSVEPGRRPTLYYNKNRGPWFCDSLIAPPWIFTINVANLGGVTVGDTVFYYVSAYDSSGNQSVNPITAPAIPNFYIITQAPLSGNYTVGLAMFNELTGRNIYFEKTVRKVIREVREPIVKSTTSLTAAKNEPISDDVELPIESKLVEAEEEIWMPMENGKPYLGELYVKKSENPEIRFPEGIEGVYATITAAIADLNLRGVNGPTNFLLVDPSYPNETYPLSIDVLNEYKPTAVNKVTIKPASGVVATISGSAAGAPIFRIISSYITIDGSNSGGTDRSLTIQNTNASSPQVIAIAPATTTPTIGVTIKNCIIINGSNTASAVVVGNPGYFNDITIQNNSIQLAYIGIYVRADPPTGSNGSAVRIIGNDLNTSGTNAIRLVGVYFQGIQRSQVANNNIGNFTTQDASNITGIWFALDTRTSSIVNNTIGPIVSTTGAPRGIAISSGQANTNIIISKNTITGISTSYSSAPYGIYIFSTTTGVTVEKNNVTGIYNTNTGGYGARGIHVNTGISASNILIKNNFVSDVKATSDVSTTYWGIGIGIEGATGSVKVYNNSVYLSGTMAGYSAATVHAAFAVITSTATDLDVRNNIFVNTFDNTNSTTDKSYAINSQAPATVFTSINYNDYYVGGPAGILGYLNSDRLTLDAWRLATGQDLNSISADPLFTSTTDLHIPRNVISPINRKATPIALVSDDFDDETRHPTYPDIGADEYTPYPPQEFTLVSPLNGAITQPLVGQLIWRKAELAEFYNVYLSIDSPPSTLVSTQTDTVYQYNLSPNQTYYWQVVALNDTQQVTEGATYSEIWKFRTEIWDVGAVSIIRPGPIGFAGNVIIPKVKVKNFGDVPQSFTVTMHIGSIYTDTKTVNNLLPQETLMVDFEPWTAVLGTYNLLAYTTLMQDNNPANDTVCGITEIQPPAHDVGVLEILSPTAETTLAGTNIVPQVRIKNFGAFTETFNVRLTIGDIYNEIVYISNFESGAESTITFPSWISLPCNYTLKCSTELDIDQLPENDVTYKTLTVQYYDVGVTGILIPQDTVFVNTEYWPAFIATNNSVHVSGPIPVTIKLTIRRYPVKMISYCSIGRSENPELVKECEWSTEIPVGTCTIISPEDWKPILWDICWISEPTYHEVIVEITAPNDMEPTNNRLSKPVTVRCDVADLQMSWTGLLIGYTPQYSETLSFRAYNVASVVTSGPYELSSIPFRAKIRIFRESDNALVYSRYLDREILRMSYLCLPFQSSFTPSTPGWYRIKSWLETRPGIDLIAENNVCERRYYFMDLLPTGTSSNITQAAQSSASEKINTLSLLIEPNPMAHRAKISWQLPIAGDVAIRIYDVNGRLVSTVFNGTCGIGLHEINWVPTNQISYGIYFCELTTENQRIRQKLVITK